MDSRYGLWTQQKRQQYIDVVRVDTAMFAIQAFAKERQDVHAHLKMDNKSALSYVKRMGGTRSPKLEQSGGSPGVETNSNSAEWKLLESILHRICTQLGLCKVDPFATWLNNQLTNYISLRPDSEARGTNTLQVSLVNLEGYAFSPFSLLDRCLQKVKAEHGCIVLVAPVWENQPWYT